MTQLIISAKDLGAFAVEGTCPRCLWVKLHVKPLPYQIFPGIFSSIDSYTKYIVHGYFDREGALPEWLTCLGDVVQYVPPPSYQKFSVLDQDTNVILRGAADGIFLMRDKSYTIVDYKTAKYTPGQESLLPVYHGQLNAYAYIANRVDIRPVSQLNLIYMEPVTDAKTAAAPELVESNGFTMRLSSTVLPVPLDPDGMIPELLTQARSMFDLPLAPDSAPGCKDCEATKALIAVTD